MVATTFSESLRACDHEVGANPIYRAYAPFFDRVFTQQDFEPDELKRLYVFDRQVYARPRYWDPAWREITVLSDEDLERQFLIPEHFSVYERELLSFLLTDLPGKALKIVGEVGSGKSSFLQLMFRSYIPEQPFGKDSTIFFVDFLDVFRLETGYDRARAVTKFCRAVLKSHPDALDIDPNLAIRYPEHALEQLSDQLAALSARLGPSHVIVILDNLDPFPPEFQRYVWEIAKDLARVASCTIIVALREMNARELSEMRSAGSETVFWTRQRGPHVHAVLQRRLDYFFETDRGVRAMRTLRMTDDESGIRLHPEDLRTFLGSVVNCLMSPEVTRAIEALTNRNIRLGLLLGLYFVRSWNLNLWTMVPRMIALNTARQHEHEPSLFRLFVNAVGLWNHRYYFSQFSSLENLLRANVVNASAAPFAKWRLLRLCALGKNGVPRDDLERDMRTFGHPAEETRVLTNALLSLPRALLETKDPAKGGAQRIEVSAAGRYYLDELIGYLDYLQLILVDTDGIMPVDVKQLHDRHISNRIAAVIRAVESLGNRELTELRQLFARDGSARQWYADVFRDELLSVSLFRGILRNLQAIGGKAEAVGVSIRMLSEQVKRAMKDLERQLEES